MRTTIDLEYDTLIAAKEIARAENTSLGKVISRLVRQALTASSTIGPLAEVANQAAPAPGRSPIRCRISPSILKASASRCRWTWSSRMSLARVRRPEASAVRARLRASSPPVETMPASNHNAPTTHPVQRGRPVVQPTGWVLHLLLTGSDTGE